MAHHRYEEKQPENHELEKALRGAYAVTQFERWFERDGHWIYRDRDHALATWRKRGIEGIPSFPGPEAGWHYLVALRRKRTTWCGKDELALCAAIDSVLESNEGDNLR